MQIEDKLKALHQLEAAKTSLENEIKCLNANIEQAQAEIVDEFESRQIKSMKIDGVGNFIMAITTAPRVVDPIAFRDWMEKNAVPWETVTALHAKKFRGWYRELLDNKQPLPDGCENYTEANIKINKV